MIVLRYLGRFLTILFAFVGAVAVIVVTAGVVLWHYLPPFRPSVPDQAVLMIDLSDGLVETRPDSPLAWATGGDALVMRQLVQGLAAAGRDDRIKGVVARLGYGRLEMAQAQELRDAILAFREQDKFAVAFAETFGEAGTGNTHYYLATAFDEIWLQPSGEVGLTGVRLESPFLQQALGALGIEPQFDQRMEYKGGMDAFTSDHMPDPVRENLQLLADSWVDQIASGIAATRDMEKTTARTLIDQGPFLAGEAKTERLVDRLGYWDEVETTTFARAGLNAVGVPVQDYVAALPPPPEQAPTIAVIYGIGPVQLNGQEDNPIVDPFVMNADTVADAIRGAVADDRIAAIVLRIDSPGGSYVASDAIWREVQRARDAGKPLIVSMASIATSGGYFVAAPARAIVAQPGTITGSIGVFGGKFVLADLWDKLGVEWDAVQAGANAEIASPNVAYSDAGWAHLQTTLDFIYTDFTEKVAAGRNLSMEQVHSAAQGRIWSGADAKAQGLVDALGGFTTAIALAREAAGIPSTAPLRLATFPPEDEGYDALLRRMLQDMLARAGITRDLVAPMARLAQAAAPIVRLLAPLAETPAPATARMPDLRTVQ